MNEIGVADWCLDVSGPDCFYRASELGFSALHMQLGSPDERWFLGHSSVRNLHNKISGATGVRISAIAVNNLDDLGLLSTENASRCKDLVQTAINTAAAMGIPLVYIPNFKNSEIQTDADLRRAAYFLRCACTFADKSGVGVATENTLGVQGLTRLLKEVNHPRLQILLDTLNPVLWQHDVIAIVDQMFSRLCGQIHAKDGVNGLMGNAPLGEGLAGFAFTLLHLKRLGFDGCIVLENDYTTDAESRVRRDIATVMALLKAA